jgi:hypothetical protein
MEAYSKGVANNRMMLGDCFRVVDYMSRYNPFNPDMNIAKPIDKKIGIKTLEAVNGEYRETIVKVYVNGNTANFYNGRDFGMREGPNSTVKLNDESKKILKEIKLSNQQTKEEVKELLDKYLEGSKLTTDFASLPADVRETAARYGVVSGTKSEWENFFMRLAYHESGFNSLDVSTIAGKPVSENSSQATSYGVFQLGLTQTYGLNNNKNWTKEQLYDPDINTRATIKLWEKNLFDPNIGFITKVPIPGKRPANSGAGSFGVKTMNEILDDVKNHRYYD